MGGSPIARRALVLAVAAAACASGGVPPGEVPGIEGRQCRYAATPEEVVEWQARLDAGGSAHPGAAAGEPAEISVRYGDEGALEWVRPLTASPAAGELARSLAASVPAEAGPGTGFRFRLRPGASPEALPGVTCPVEHTRARQVLSAALRSVSFSDMQAVAQGKLEFDLEVQVDPTGRPLDTRVRRGRGQAPAIERAVGDAAMRERYLPALHDGFPVIGTYTFEVRLETRVQVRRVG